MLRSQTVVKGSIPVHPADSSVLSPQSSLPSHSMNGLIHLSFLHLKWLDGQLDGTCSIQIWSNI